MSAPAASPHLLHGRSPQRARAGRACAGGEDGYDRYPCREKQISVLARRSGRRILRGSSGPSASANSAFIKKSDKPDAIKEFEGAIARTPFVAGEPLRVRIA